MITGWFLVASGRAQMPAPPGQVAAGEKPKYEAYLFAHMMQGDYGRLYYSVSLDGLHWQMLNGLPYVISRHRVLLSPCNMLRTSSSVVWEKSSYQLLTA